MATNEDAESEFAMGSAAMLQRLVDDDANELGLRDVTLSLGGGGGVWALRPGRAVQDLDMRLSCPPGTSPELRQQLLERVKGHLADAAFVQPSNKNSAPTTVRGTYGGVEVSITLAPQPTTELSMNVQGKAITDFDPSDLAPVALNLVAPTRLLMDKMLALAYRQEKEGEILQEKRFRDAHDILALVEKVFENDVERAANTVWEQRENDFAPSKFAASLKTFTQNARTLNNAFISNRSKSKDIAQSVGVEPDDMSNLMSFVAALNRLSTPQKGTSAPTKEEIARLRKLKEERNAQKKRAKDDSGQPH